MSDRLIDYKELRTLVPYSYQHILRLEKAGLFPKRVPAAGTKSFWSFSEIQEWIKGQKAQRDEKLDMDDDNDHSDLDK